VLDSLLKVGIESELHSIDHSLDLLLVQLEFFVLVSMVNERLYLLGGKMLELVLLDEFEPGSLKKHGFL
jgi:hypothetical protein